MKNCVVLGVGLIGQQFIRMLDGHPDFNLGAIVASSESEGKSLQSKWALPSFEVPESFQSMQLTNYNSLDFDDIDVVFSALPASKAIQVEKKLSMKGIKIFSNAASYRYQKDVPILIPEINAHHLDVVKNQESYLKNKGFIVANSNCTVSGLSIFINEMLKISPIKNIFVSSYQAISGAGFEGLKDIPRDHVIPFIPKEEEKMEIESKKILGNLNKSKTEIISDQSFNMLANCARVPVIDGHLEALTVEFEENLGLETIRSIVNSLENPVKGLPTAPDKHFLIVEGVDRPNTSLDLYNPENQRSSGMGVSIGRLRLTNNYLRCYLLVHNTIRGGAGGSILNAELAIREGLL